MTTRTTAQPSFRMLRSVALIGTDVVFALFAMMAVVRWRYDFLNEVIRNDIDHRAAWITAAVTLVTWVVMRQDRAIWRFTTLHDFRKLLMGIAVVPQALILSLASLALRPDVRPQARPRLSRPH